MPFFLGERKMVVWGRYCHLVVLTLLWAGNCQAAPPVYVPDIIVTAGNPKLIVEVIDRQVSRDGREMTLVLRPPQDHFYLGLDLTRTDLRSLELVVRNIRTPKRLEYFFDSRKDTPLVDLIDSQGVRIEEVGEDCRIHFDRHAIRVLAPGGRLRYMAKPIPKDEKEKPPEVAAAAE